MPARRSGRHKPRCTRWRTRWRDDGSRASRAPRNARDPVPVSAPGNRARSASAISPDRPGDGSQSLYVYNTTGTAEGIVKIGYSVNGVTERIEQQIGTAMPGQPRLLLVIATDQVPLSRWDSPRSRRRDHHRRRRRSGILNWGRAGAVARAPAGDRCPGAVAPAHRANARRRRGLSVAELHAVTRSRARRRSR